MKSGMNHNKSASGRLARQTQRLMVAMIISALAGTNLLMTTFAAEGDLDPLFGNGGIVTTTFSPFGDNASAVAIQADGRIVVVGISGSEGPSDFAVARYNTDGSPDDDFGVKGKTTTDFLGDQDQANAVAIQADGRIVVAGLSGFNGPNANFALARYNTDGSPDNDFGIGGRVTTDFFGKPDEIKGIAIQADGRLVVAGRAGLNNNSTDFALARYDAQGALDINFGSGGKVTTDFFGTLNGDAAAAVAVQSDGRIVAAGFTYVDGFVSDFALTRYNTDGSPDNNFGSGGKLTTDFLGESDAAAAVAIQPNGYIVAAGRQSSNTPAASVGLVRYTQNGSLDPAFGVGGKVTTDFLGQPAEANALVIQPDGRIVVAGRARVNDQSDFAVARYETNGSIDNSFGSAGRVTTDFLDENDDAFGIALQSDGRIVVAGSAFLNDSFTGFAVARYIASSPVLYDVCVQDASTDNLFRFNSATGQYLFTVCGNPAGLGGAGTLTTKGCVIALKHNTLDRKVLVKVDTCTKKATASVQDLASGATYSIQDRDITNNNCGCPGQP